VKKFNLYIDRLEAWSKKTIEFLANAELGSTIGEVRAKLKNHDVFVEEAGAMTDRKSKANAFADELRAMDYILINDVDARLQALDGVFGDVNQAGEDRKQRLEEELARQQKIEDMLLDFAKRAKQLMIWLENDADEALNNPIEIITIEDIQAMQGDFEAFVEGRAAKESDLQELTQISADIAETGFSESTFSEVTLADLQSKWDEQGSQIDSRRADLQQELELQQSFEQMRVSFADKAKEVDAFIVEQQENVQNAEGESEAVVESLRSLLENIVAGQAQLDELAQLQNQLNDNKILDNPHTDLTYDSLASRFDALQFLCKNKLSGVEKEVLQKSESSLTPEQLKEFRECFDHFDKDKSGVLDRLEFGACLKSLGQDINMDEGGNLDGIMAIVDSDNTGQVEFDEFCKYMESVISDVDNSDQIKQAFKLLAGDKDYVTEAELRQSGMPNEKVDYLLQNMPKYEGVEGGYDYNAFTDDCYAR